MPSHRALLSFVYGVVCWNTKDLIVHTKKGKVYSNLFLVCCIILVWTVMTTVICLCLYFFFILSTPFTFGVAYSVKIKSIISCARRVYKV